MQHYAEHNRGFFGDIVFCIQPWSHTLPFAAGKFPESIPDAAIANVCRIGVSALGGIPAGRRLPVVLYGEDLE